MNESSDDASLIRQIQTGTPADASTAFEQLVLRHGSHLLLYLSFKGLTPDEQDDISNETWCRAWGKIARFESRGFSIFPWIRKIANLVTLEHFRSKYLGEPIDEDSGTLDEQSQGDPEDIVARQVGQDELHQAVLEVIVEAPQDYRDLIEAMFMVGFAPQEIAQLYGWSMSKVYVTKLRALAWLRQRFVERYGSEAIRDWLP